MNLLEDITVILYPESSNTIQLHIRFKRKIMTKQTKTEALINYHNQVLEAIVANECMIKMLNRKVIGTKIDQVRDEYQRKVQELKLTINNQNETLEIIDELLTKEGKKNEKGT